MEEMNQPHKVSIRFFNDKEVRAAWDNEGNRWLFSVVDVIAVLTESANPRNYWKVMKYRLSKEGDELVTRCNQLKLVANDGKRYLTDCLPQDELLNLIEATPSKHAIAFARWLISGEDQIDCKSRDKAYQLWDSSLLQTIEVGTSRGLQQIHAYFFGGLYDLPDRFGKRTLQKVVFSLLCPDFLDRRLLRLSKCQNQHLMRLWISM